MMLVSACLAGIKCGYDGGSRPNRKVIELVKTGKAIPVCPEQLGGLTTPRVPAEQKGNRVVTKDGTDVTENFRRGAEEGLRVARLAGCKTAVLRTPSPSCGCGLVYDGTFSGRLKEGDGVFAALLKKSGITVMSDGDFSKDGPKRP